MINKINIELIDQLLKDYKSPEDALDENAILQQLTKPFSNAESKPNPHIISVCRIL